VNDDLTFKVVTEESLNLHLMKRIAERVGGTVRSRETLRMHERTNIYYVVVESLASEEDVKKVIEQINCSRKRVLQRKK
jgi:hypothetical protein